MNELRSYTEYDVRTPQSDFAIGFDFDYNKDAVHVTVDGEDAASKGYTVTFKNSSTITLDPPVDQGVVRLQRETDIDKSKHVFSAGAKFTAQNVDENFKQIRHSQQEIIDYSTQTREIVVDTLDQYDQRIDTVEGKVSTFDNQLQTEIQERKQGDLDNRRYAEDLIGMGQIWDGISSRSVWDYPRDKNQQQVNDELYSELDGFFSHTQDLLNPHQVSKDQVGLGNVDNTSDADKPVSTATQIAISNAVAPKADKTYVDQLVINANNGVTNYQTEVELLAFVPTTTNYTAKALDTKKVWLWDGTQWNDTGLSEYDLAVEYVDEKIQHSDEFGLDFVSEDSFKFARISNNVLDLSTVLMTKDDNIKGLSVESQDGFNLLDNAEKFKVERTQDGLISFVSKDGFKLQTGQNSPFDIENIVNELIKPVSISTNQPLFTDLLVGFADEDININVECLIAQRALQRKQRTVTAAIAASGSNYFKQSTEMLSIQADKIEGAAKLYLRDINSYNYTSLDVTVKSVAKSGLSGSPKILMIGDSITNRGGAAIVDSVLREAGMTPSFIGTITGAGTNEDALGTAGKLNEGREGWRTTQFTNALANKTPVPVGGESAYMALVKNDKIKWNPFIREATSSDSSSIIKNGYVLDFEFYRSRFSLDAPDIVVLQLGTNDVVYAPTTSEQDVYDSILLIMQRLRVAFPSCKIIVSSVGRAISTETSDAQYDSLYPPVFRSTQKAIKDSGLSNVYFCPSFAIADTFTGFPVTATETDAISGAITGAYSDGLHPTYSGRQTLYTNIAAYIAAATTNII